MNLVRAFFSEGVVDLDPCSDRVAQTRVQAKKYFGPLEDGLQQGWHGRVFVNPAFGVQSGHSQQGAYFLKAVHEYQAGNASEVLLLLKVAVGYDWFSPLLQWPHAWLHNRVSFIAGSLSEGNCAAAANPYGSIVVYLGPTFTGSVWYLQG